MTLSSRPALSPLSKADVAYVGDPEGVAQSMFELIPMAQESIVLQMYLFAGNGHTVTLRPRDGAFPYAQMRRLSAKVKPAPIACRPKSMFKAVPVFSDGEVSRWVNQLLSRESLRKTGYFDANAVARERALLHVLPTWSPRRYVVDGSFTGVVAT